MLRVETKKKLIQILEDAILLCEKALNKEDTVLISVLQEVQDALIVVGERLEKEVEDISQISMTISKMEQLCETFYILSEHLENRVEYGKSIDVLLRQVVADVSALDAGYQIMFFPYKADMWDSMESIWLACREDSRCDCKVIPIPYYSFDAEKNEWTFCYEIDRFPDYVSVINYEDCPLEEGIDAAFVHNPYDEYNYVTHIHSDYYSYNLKKYVKKLFYVPYYVTSGFIAEDHKMLSVYPNADYLVVQSESFKEGLKGLSYYKKAIVLGSPKLDRVIQLSGKESTIPEEWRSILKGKHSLMLNTSLYQFLQDGEAYLQKIAYLFDVVKRRKAVVIIWRPHPLLQSTIESMRPHLLNTFLELQASFIDNQIGILDKTPDIINTVAVVDGYIGEASSSVVNLFEAAGKPLFILENYIRESLTDEQEHMYLMDCEKIGDTYYGISLENNGIYAIEESKWNNMRGCAEVEGAVRWLPASGKSAVINHQIYYAPIWSEEFYCYDVNENQIEEISSIKEKKPLNYVWVIAHKDKLFYLPGNSKMIREYSTTNRSWKEYRQPILDLQKGITERIWEDIFSYYEDGECIWMTNLYSNRILRFDMRNGQYRIFEIGDASARYSAVAVVENKLYLSDAYTGAISVWNMEGMREEATYLMPNGYKTFINVQGRGMAHYRLYVTNQSLFAIPLTANALIQMDLKTGNITMLAKEFWSDVLKPLNYYKPEAHGVITFAKMVDKDTLFIQKRRNADLLELNVHTGEYKIHHPKLADGELEQMLDGDDGFEKSYTNGEFARRESRYFSFEDFLDDLVNNCLDDAMGRQKKEMETMAVNLDGTCGEKVHAFMMNVLEKG